MATKKFRDVHYPEDAYLTADICDGNVIIETANRFEGERRFTRETVTVSADDFRKMVTTVERAQRKADRAA